MIAIVEKVNEATRASFPQFIYVPWNDGNQYGERADAAVALALELSAETDLQVVAVAATKQMLPGNWDKRAYQTRKSSMGIKPGPAVSVHLWPSLDDLAAMPPNGVKHAFIVEYGVDDLSGWARHNHAVHYDTGKELSSELSEEALALYERISWNGNNGWHDAPGKRDAMRDLRKLQTLGEFDRNDLACFMIGRHSHTDIRQLLKLAGRV